MVYKIDYESVLDSLINHIPNPIFWKDAELIFRGCNKQFSIQFGYDDPFQIIGKSDRDFPFTPELIKKYHKDDYDVLTTGVAKVNFEETQRQPDGSVKTVLVSKVPLFRENKIVGILGIYSDITQRKQMEEQLRAAKEAAEAANLAKSEFLSTISHELRTPLVGILGIAQMVDSGRLPKSLRGDLKNIMMAGDHLLSLVNDLLDFTKLEVGKFELHPAMLDLRTLCEEVTTILSAKANSKGLEIILDYETTAPLKVLGDTRALRQILLNLIGNSLKFTEKGYVLLKVTCLEQAEKQCVFDISVQDTGIGIPVEKLEAIFERFTQVDSSVTRRYGGTGLGLTLCKDLIKLMGGSIQVTSKLNEGSTFSCIIPFETESETEESTSWDMYKAKTRILIVDESRRGKVLERQLSSNNNSLVTGSEALASLLNAQRWGAPFDIVLLDEGLTSTDAIRLAKNIAAENRIHKPMLIFLQSRSGTITKRRMFFEIWTKPIQPSELFTNLTAAWERWQEKRKDKIEILLTTTKNAKVLLVEDDPMVQIVHRRMLDKLGCEYDLAVNGHQALEMSKNKYDLILMDIGLPEMNGIDVVKIIRQRENGSSKTPVIGLTAYGEEDMKEQCIAAGIDEVAVKPISQSTLYDIINRWVGTEEKI